MSRFPAFTRRLKGGRFAQKQKEDLLKLQAEEEAAEAAQVEEVSPVVVEEAEVQVELEPDEESESVEEVEWSLRNKKGELLQAAKDLGLDVNSTMTKKQILKKIESA